MDCENLPPLKRPMKQNLWRFLPCHSPGPVEHMGIVGICPMLSNLVMYSEVSIKRPVLLNDLV